MLCFQKGGQDVLGQCMKHHTSSYIIIHRHAIQYYPILSEYIKIVLDSFDTLWISMTLRDRDDIYICIHTYIYIYPLHVRTFMIIFVCECMCMSKQRCLLMNVQRRNLSPLRANCINQYVYTVYISILYIHNSAYSIWIDMNSWPFCSPHGLANTCAPRAPLMRWSKPPASLAADAMIRAWQWTWQMPWLMVQVWHWTSDFVPSLRVVPQVPGIDGHNNDNHKCAVRQLKCDMFFEVIMRGHSVVIVSIHGSLAQIVRGLRCLVKDHGRFYNGSGVMQLERHATPKPVQFAKRMAGLFRSSLGHAEPIFWIRDGIGHCNDPPSLGLTLDQNGDWRMPNHEIRWN